MNVYKPLTLDPPPGCHRRVQWWTTIVDPKLERAIEDIHNHIRPVETRKGKKK